MSKFLCYLNIHNWRYCDSLDGETQIMTRTRTCLRCRLKQQLDEGTKIGLIDQWYNIKGEK